MKCRQDHLFEAPAIQYNQVDDFISSMFLFLILLNMKLHTYITTACIVGIFSLTAYAQHPLSDVSPNPMLSTQHSPEDQRLNNLSLSPITALCDSSYTWVWNDSSSSWGLSSKELYIYNTQNQIAETTFLDWTGTDWVLWRRQFNIYNTHNQTDSILMVEWANQTWNNLGLTVYIYDANDQVVNIVKKAWKNGAWENTAQYTYTYDSNNDRVKYLVQFWNNGAWENSSQEFYTYNTDHTIADLVHQAWTTGLWENLWRMTYTYDLNLNLTDIQQEGWQNTSWEILGHTVYTYDPNNNRTNTHDSLWDGTSWQPMKRTTEAYDTNNNRTNYLQETRSNSTWINDFELHWVYDANDVEKILVYTNWDQSGSSIQYADSTLYFYHLINGIPEKQQAQGFRLYPNPFSTQTMLLFDQEQHNSRIRVFDEMGREVENQSFSGRHFILNRDRLPSGNYFIQVTDNHGGRMAKQITIR